MGTSILPSRYQIGDVIGKSLSTVYRAFDSEDKAPIAVKHGLSRFIVAEFEVLKNFEHPSIVKVFDLYTCGRDTSSYTMEICISSLAECLARIGKLPAEMQVSIESQISTGIELFHGRGLNHGNICPENVLVRSANPIDVCLSDPLILKVFDPDRDFRQFDDLMIQVRSSGLDAP